MIFRDTFSCQVYQTIYENLRFGIFCLNKPKHLTSTQTLEVLKHRLCLDNNKKEEIKRKLKVGHGGTLDSSATGVLVVGLGQGCKILSKFLNGKKTYLANGKLGEATDTYNDVGIITHKSDFRNISKSDLLSCLDDFKGKILQRPPPYCALKRCGRRISDIIRSGEQVILHPRIVECYSIECLKFDLPHFTLKISCGGGFYVRSLVHDLGKALGSFAHVTELCRLQQDPFALEDCLSFDQLNLKNVLLSVSHLRHKYFNVINPILLNCYK